MYIHVGMDEEVHDIKSSGTRVIDSCLKLLLDTEPGSFRRTTNGLNCWSIFSATDHIIFKLFLKLNV